MALLIWKGRVQMKPNIRRPNWVDRQVDTFDETEPLEPPKVVEPKVASPLSPYALAAIATLKRQGKIVK